MAVATRSMARKSGVSGEELREGKLSRVFHLDAGIRQDAADLVREGRAALSRQQARVQVGGGDGRDHVGAGAALEDRGRQRVAHERRVLAIREETTPEGGIRRDRRSEIGEPGPILGGGEGCEVGEHVRHLGHDADRHLEALHALQGCDESGHCRVAGRRRAMPRRAAGYDAKPAGALLGDRHAPHLSLVLVAHEDAAALGEEVRGAQHQVRALPHQISGAPLAAGLLVRGR